MNILASVDNHSPCLNWGCQMVSLLILLFYWLAFFVKESSPHLVFFPSCLLTTLPASILALSTPPAAQRSMIHCKAGHIHALFNILQRQAQTYELGTGLIVS